jgi:predicted permease
VFAAVVSSNYFSTLAVPLAAGRGFLPDEERPGRPALVAVASYDVWRRSGFAPDFIGGTVRVNAADFTIVGVAPKGFVGTIALAGPEWWFPLSAYDQVVVGMFRDGGAGGLADRSHGGLMVAGILRPSMTRANAQAVLDPLARRLSQAYPETDRDRRFVLAPLQRMGVSTNPGDNLELAALSTVLLLMSALVLLVACLNLANLMLARGVRRRREIAVRLALGASRARIVWQLMVEALLLSVGGAAGGVVLAWWTSNLIAASMAGAFPIAITVDLAPDVRVLAAAAGFAVLSTVCFALGPAWSLSRPDLLPDMKLDTGSPAASKGRIGRWLNGPALVVAQLAVSLALVAAGGLFVRSALRVASTDAGFSVDRQLVIGVDPSLSGYDEVQGRRLQLAALDRIRGLSGVESVGSASTVPFGDMSEGSRVRLPGSEEDGARPIFQVIGADYFSTLGLRMLRGREFTRLEEVASPGASRLAIVDAPLARTLFGGEDAVGRQILVRDSDRSAMRAVEIIGVAPGIRHNLFDQAPTDHLYMATGGTYRSTMNMHVRLREGASEQAMLETINRELHALDSRLPIVSMHTMAGQRDASVQTWAVRTAASLFSAFGALALLLATIGVYGLQAYDVSRRTREIGIRLALGAETADIAWLVVGAGVRTVLWGLLIGLAAAAGIGRLVSGFLFRSAPFDPFVLSAASAALVAAALLACYVPARRATRVQPLDALRSE